MDQVLQHAIIMRAACGPWDCMCRMTTGLSSSTGSSTASEVAPTTLSPLPTQNPEVAWQGEAMRSDQHHMDLRVWPNYGIEILRGRAIKLWASSLVRCSDAEVSSSTARSWEPWTKVKGGKQERCICKCVQNQDPGLGRVLAESLFNRPRNSKPQVSAGLSAGPMLPRNSMNKLMRLTEPGNPLLPSFCFATWLSTFFAALKLGMCEVGRVCVSQNGLVCSRRMG